MAKQVDPRNRIVATRVGLTMRQLELLDRLKVATGRPLASMVREAVDVRLEAERRACLEVSGESEDR